MGGLRGYFTDIYEGICSSIEGLILTLKHLVQARKRTNAVGINDAKYFTQATGIVTLEYPTQAFPVPDNGRYRLHNEIDDCIVCDKCAKICPVDCIDITSIKSTKEIGLTSDGSSKRLYASTFDIDMAKCCYCGLCTTVCPTECLTMTSTFDFSEFDVKNMVYHFTNLTPEEAKEKQTLYEVKQAEKAAVLAAKSQVPVENPAKVSSEGIIESNKPAFKPKFPVSKPVEIPESEQIDSTPKPVFRPKMPAVKIADNTIIENNKPEENIASSVSKPVFRPKIPALAKTETQSNQPAEETPNEAKLPETEKPISIKPVFKPKMKSLIPPKRDDEPL